MFATEATAKRALKQESTFDDPSKAQLEKKLYEIQTGQAIDYAGSLPGYRKGVHHENGLMLYCMQAPELPVEIAPNVCKGRLKSAAGGAEWRGGRKVQHLQIKKENVARYGTMGRYTP